MRKVFGTNVSHNADALPRTVDVDCRCWTALSLLEHRKSCTNSFNRKTILKPTSREQCSPSTCLGQELNQHPIKNRSSL